jgi:catechol 2,3-dioxygenase-like lactoylglutathione lyase family enzyme
MGFHHIALATRDTAATHDFYTRVMGFRLVKVVSSPTPGEGDGWSKHFFYDTSGDANAADQGMLAFWEIHDDQIGTDFEVNLNKAAGLPWWVNHLAFDAPTLEALHTRRDHWRRCGHTVLEVDHEFCVSIYLRDPNGNMVEFCHTKRPFTPEEHERALHVVLGSEKPSFDGEAAPTVWTPLIEAPTG